MLLVGAECSSWTGVSAGGVLGGVGDDEGEVRIVTTELIGGSFSGGGGSVAGGRHQAESVAVLTRGLACGGPGEGGDVVAADG